VKEQALASKAIIKEARVLMKEVEVLDLHLDTLIPHRILGWDPRRRHRRGLGLLMGQFDLPRAQDGLLTAAMWSITTNPFRRASSRWRCFLRNLERFEAMIAATEGISLAADGAEYHAARDRGERVALLAIQGGHALEAAPLESPLPRSLSRVTLVHLTNSYIGATSSPLGFFRRQKGLSTAGCFLVERLNAERVMVDLAHIHPQGFWDALEVHAPDLPPVVTHTGASGVYPHWRNLSDAQIRAIASRGGVIGIMLHRFFLSRWGLGGIEAVLKHMEHVIQIGGEEALALGTDFDGAIIPPWRLRSVDLLPYLVAGMLSRGWSPTRISRALGGNALRLFKTLRPGPT